MQQMPVLNRRLRATNSQHPSRKIGPDVPHIIDLPFNKLFGNAMHRKGHIQNMWMTTFAAHSQLDRKVRLHYITERRCFTHALHLEVDCRRCFPPRARYPWSEFSRSFCPHGTGTHGGTATANQNHNRPQESPKQTPGRKHKPSPELRTHLSPPTAGGTSTAPGRPGQSA